MKKRLTIIGMLAGILCLGFIMAFSQINQNASNEPSFASANDLTVLLPNHIVPEFHYRVGPRFYAITKEDLNKALSVDEILPKDANWTSYTVNSVSVSEVRDLRKLGAFSKVGENLNLTNEQLALLNSADYSDSFRFTASYGDGNKVRPSGESFDLAYFVTVVPEKQAYFQEGNDELTSYLKRGSQISTQALEEEKLTPGKIVFTVNTKGEVSNLRLTESCSYQDIDKLMIRLISETSGKWQPATNEAGKKVDQELVYSYGRVGC